MAFQIIQNKTGYVDPYKSALDTGWTITEGYAVHVACNSGSIKSMTSLGLVIGRAYVITYTVDQLTSGGVKVVCGAANGTNRTAAGTYTETITCTTTAQLSFFSDGSLRVSQVKFYDLLTGLVTGTTISFNELKNQWGCEYTMQPERMIRFLDKFFMVKGGALWEQNVNPIRNNFFGVQYVSKVTFYMNINPTTEKMLYSMRVESNKRWFCANNGDIYLVPIDGKPAGMSSRLKKMNFKKYRSSFYADFMRNMLDPRFNNTEVALFRGEQLVGRFAEITITNDDTVAVSLYEVDVKSSPVSITY